MWDFAVQKRSYNHKFIIIASVHTAIRKMYKGKKFREKIITYKKAEIKTKHIYITDEIEDPEIPLI
jgi:hypothetical protein